MFDNLNNNNIIYNIKSQNIREGIMAIKIITDSSCDLPIKYINKMI